VHVFVPTEPAAACNQRDCASAAPGWARTHLRLGQEPAKGQAEVQLLEAAVHQRSDGGESAAAQQPLLSAGAHQPDPVLPFGPASALEAEGAAR